MQPGGIQYWGRFEAFRKEGLQIWTRYHKPLRTLRLLSLLRNGSSWNKFVIIMNNDDILAHKCILSACWNKYICKRFNLFVNCQIITMVNYYYYGGVNMSLLLILLIIILLLWSTKILCHCKGLLWQKYFNNVGELLGEFLKYSRKREYVSHAVMSACITTYYGKGW